MQNWKRRWFVLLRNELKYFNNKDDKEPIKAINLYDATSVTRDDSCGKSHCFRYMFGSVISLSTLTCTVLSPHIHTLTKDYDYSW